MNPSYSQLTIHTLPLSSENWVNTLRESVPERPYFQLVGDEIHIGQVVARFLGIPIDQDEYYNQLFEYVHSSNPEIHLLSDGNLNKNIPNQQFQAIQKVLNFHRDQNLSINRFIAFLDGEQLLIKHQNPAIFRKIRSSFKEMLELFSKVEKDGLKNAQLQRILVDVIKWSFNHLDPVLKEANPETSLPKFLWYGNFKKSHQYFLYFLYKIGNDLIMFHPNGLDPFEMIDPGKELTLVHHFPEKHEPEPFPEEKRRRLATVAYRASKEIETILNHEGSHLYKPWQLREYSPSSVTLKTTYDELFLLVKEPAMIRPNFDVKDREVKIPAVFAKILGVSKNRKEYWDRLQALTKSEFSLLIRNFPITSGGNYDFRYHYRNALGADGQLQTQKIMAGHYWKYQQLPIGLQAGLANAIRSICAKPFLKQIVNESMEDVRIYMFTQSMQIPTNIIRLLQKFDYSQDVPKLILYNNQMNGALTRSDAVLLLLLNQFGVDLILYNPSGHNDIETYISEGLFDTHWLEDVVFDQEFRETSSFLKKNPKNLLNGILKNLKGD